MVSTMQFLKFLKKKFQIQNLLKGADFCCCTEMVISKAYSDSRITLNYTRRKKKNKNKQQMYTSGQLLSMFKGGEYHVKVQFYFYASSTHAVKKQQFYFIKTTRYIKIILNEKFKYCSWLIRLGVT